MRRVSWTCAWTLLLLLDSEPTSVLGRHAALAVLPNPYEEDTLACPVGTRSMGRHCKFRRPQYSRKYYLLCRRRRGGHYQGDGRLDPYDRLPSQCPEKYLCVGHSPGGDNRSSSISCIASKIVRAWQRDGVSAEEQRRITQPWLTQPSTSGTALAPTDAQPQPIAASLEVVADTELHFLADVAVRGVFDLNELPEETLSDCEIDGPTARASTSTARCSAEMPWQVSRPP